MTDGPIQKRMPAEIPQHEQPEVVSEKHEVPSITPAERVITEKPKPEGTPISAPPVVPMRAQKKSPLRLKIENVMEESLLPLYKELTPKQRLQFKNEGERTAAKIEIILRRTQVKIIEIIRLIRRWLQLLPGVNIFFLEQEAKIKAEKLLALKEKEQSRSK